MEHKIWKDIEDWEGIYRVSNMGEIESLPRKRVLAPRLLKHIKQNTGYMTVFLHGKPRQKKILFVHRLLAKAFIPNPNNLPQVNHIDGNPGNNSLENLEWCTQSHNIQHAYNTGRKYQEIGDMHPGAKLDSAQVRVIKSLTSPKKEVNYADLARYFKVNERTIRSIKDGLTWTHID